MVLMFSDAKDNDGTELYRKIQIVPSGSFKTTLTTTFKKFTSPAQNSNDLDVKWS